MELVLVAIAVTSVAVEFYKKAIRGVKTDEGVKTKASRWEIYIIALLFSVAWGVALMLIQNNGQWVWIPVYTAIVYFFQWLIDMKLIKQVVNGLLSRMGG